MVLINGESRHVIEISDRGFQYGDGLFETIAVFDRKPLFWQQHLDRLLSGCQALGIPAPAPAVLLDEIRQLCHHAAPRAVLKIIITRGSGGRGYRLPDHPVSTRVLALHPYPCHPDSCHLEGIRLRLCKMRLGHNRLLAGLKHLNRLEQILARAEWDDETIQEGLLCDQHGHIVEGTMSNIFLVVDDKLVTPRLDRCGVAGIVRRWIFESGFDVTETRVDMAMVDRASELFVTNSIIGIWPVQRFEARSLVVGALTRRLQTAYTAACIKQIDEVMP
ncbi:MAG: aminodeoxychorismate lyase [Methylomonas sp.]|nr:aminodeoxychorismate lyase [Methylomonas sp.]PPD20578.1 MAG: aminodeoxychorismate lyase [Methylomonas sp.]PPD25644.1 MAG: aminodeoxychorismate lyase [Methylomonas sp.]PPD36631.1 MAG: aminodeoxychorismate lyase [Methylomonas sp.]PPD42821.1 MAG: aminodeoxychorismate lyase [Methylomonas sp.]